MDFAFVTRDIGNLLDQIGHDVILQKVTKATDTYGRTTTKTPTESTITGYIHPVSAENMENQSVGWVPGKDAMGVFLTASNVARRDIIVDGSIYYEIVEILQQPQIGAIVPFIRCRLRLVDNG